MKPVKKFNEKYENEIREKWSRIQERFLGKEKKMEPVHWLWRPGWDKGVRDTAQGAVLHERASESKSNMSILSKHR